MRRRSGEQAFLQSNSPAEHHFCEASAAGLQAQLAGWKRLGKGTCMAAIAAFDCTKWIAGLRAAGAFPLLLEAITLLVRAMRGSQPADSIAEALAIASVLAILCNAAYPQWQWELGWQAALQIKALTGSALAVDLLAKLVPGAPCASTLDALKKREVAAITKGGAELRDDTFARGTYDGVGKRSIKGCRVSAAKAKGFGEAVTSMKFDHLLIVPPAGQPPSPNLQKLVTCSPAMYNTPERRASLPHDFASVSDADLALLGTEGLAVLSIALDHVLSRCTLHEDGSWFDPLVEAERQRAASSPAASAAASAAAPPPKLLKLCPVPGCPGGGYTVHATTCSCCQGPLPAMADVRLQKLLSPQQPPKAAAPRRVHRVVGVVKIACTTADGSVGPPPPPRCLRRLRRRCPPPACPPAPARPTAQRPCLRTCARAPRPARQAVPVGGR
jgi:hypothetical protein